MLAMLVGQASAGNVLSGIIPGSVRVFSKPKISEREIEWSLLGDYDDFVSTTVTPTLHVVNQVMDGAKN